MATDTPQTPVRVRAWDLAGAAALAARFPHLDHFLNTYMHQDWNLYGNSLQDVLRFYADDTSLADMVALRSDIKDFIASEGVDLETDYYILFPNSVMPSAWHMSVDQWLRRIDELVQQTMASKNSSLPRTAMVIPAPKPPSQVGVITVTVPDDVELAQRLYDAIEAFVGKVVPDFSGAVSLHFENQEQGDDPKNRQST